MRKLKLILIIMLFLLSKSYSQDTAKIVRLTFSMKFDSPCERVLYLLHLKNAVGDSLDAEAYPIISESQMLFNIDVSYSFVQRSNKISILGSPVGTSCAPKYFALTPQIKNFVSFEIDSKPTGAKVYLIPLLTYERSKKLRSTPEFLEEYIRPEGPTNIMVYLDEENYIAILKYEKITVQRKCRPIKSKPQNKIFVDFNTRL